MNKPGMMKWNEITGEEQLKEIDSISKSDYVLIFKHSTRCGTSAMILNRIERRSTELLVNNLKPYYLNLIKYREISGVIERVYNVPHQSPQVLIVKDGSCIYHASHFAITIDELVSVANNSSASGGKIIE